MKRKMLYGAQQMKKPTTVRKISLTAWFSFAILHCRMRIHILVYQNVITAMGNKKEHDYLCVINQILHNVRHIALGAVHIIVFDTNAGMLKSKQNNHSVTHRVCTWGV